MELLSAAEMAEADRLTIAGGTPGRDLMENAGRAVADAIGRLPGRRVLVFAGPGNNGGDGFVAARHLAQRGYTVKVSLVGDRARLKGDAAWAAASWEGAVAPASPEDVAAQDIIIDAIFGAGLDRPIEGRPRLIIEAVNKANASVVSVDLPSGVNGTTGAVMGVAVDADHTVTFFRRKIGHVLLPGRLRCGAIHVADIGISESVLEKIRPNVFANGPERWGDVFPQPNPESHKYTRGHVVVVSGALPSTGAARLAARGALRAGAGLVTIASPVNAVPVHAAANTAVMVRAVEGAQELESFLQDQRRNVVVMGPGAGIGEAMREQVLVALRSRASVVLDADALTSFEANPALLFDAINAKAAGSVVLTPHAGEFERLFNKIENGSKNSNKLEKARWASRHSAAVVVLKGADTVIADPRGVAVIAENAPPGLATAGSGDVLAGIIGGLLAQGMPAFEGAAAGVWLQGEAANRFGPGLIAEDLPETLPAVYRPLFAQLMAEEPIDRARGDS
ncbi:MAG: NAD(P)H-hydrate dehydratase [Acidobacteriota bacterium]